MNLYYYFKGYIFQIIIENQMLKDKVEELEQTFSEQEYYEKLTE